MNRTPRAVLALAPALAGVLGLAYTFGDAGRTTSTSFNAAKDLARELFPSTQPMHVWGMFFLAGCGVMSVAIGLNHYKTLSVAMWVGGLMYVWWASCFALSAIQDPAASLVAWALYLVVAVFHFMISHRAWVSA